MLQVCRVVYFLALLLIFSEHAYSYFDHGTGSLIVQAIVAFFGMLVVYMHRAKQLILYYIRRIFGKAKRISDQDDLTQSKETDSADREK